MATFTASFVAADCRLRAADVAVDTPELFTLSSSHTEVNLTSAREGRDAMNCDNKTFIGTHAKQGKR